MDHHLLRRALVSRRVFMQIELMVILRIPPLAGRNNLRRKSLLIPLLGYFIRNLLRNLVLLVAMREDGTTVLRTDIRTLAVLGRWVVHAVEEF